MDEESAVKAEAHLIPPDSSIGKRRLGVLKVEGFVLGEAFFEPLPEDELRLWEGEGSESCFESIAGTPQVPVGLMVSIFP
jgi:hypothetical protein